MRFTHSLQNRGRSSWAARTISPLLSMALLISTLASGVFVTAAPALAAFTPSAYMPTSPGVKAGQEPNGSWGRAVDRGNGGFWRIQDQGTQTAVFGPSGLTSTIWGDFQANVKYIGVNKQNHHAFVIGPTNTELTELDGSVANIRSTAGAILRHSTQGITGFTELAVDSSTGFVYLVNTARNSIFEFDPASSTWGELPLLGQTPTAIAVDSTRGAVYVTMKGSNQVEIIDLSNYSQYSVSVGSQPWGISLDESDGKAYVANSAGQSVSILNISSIPGSVSQTLNFPTLNPKVLDIDTLNKFLYIGSTTTGAAVVDIRANNTVTEIAGYGSSIFSIAADPVNRLAYYSTNSLAQPGYYYANTVGYIPDITSAAPVANGTIGTAYAGHQMTAIGSATITYSKTSGTMPNGLSISSTGAITGTPTTPGTFTFTITADNGFGTDSETYTITIPVPPPTLSATSFATGIAGEVYKYAHPWYGPQDYVLTSTWLGSSYAAVGTDSFQISAGSLPPGLSLNANTGAISGTPSASINAITTYNFTVLGTNRTATTTESYSITINPAQPIIDPNLTWSTAPAEGTNNYAWMWPTLATGSSSATWTVSSGSLPAGLTLDPTPGSERITGTVTAPAGTSYTFTLRATNASSGLYDEMTFTGTVTAAPPSNGWGNFSAYEGVPYYFDPMVSMGMYQAITGSLPMTWALSVNSPDWSLPSGLSIDPNTGVISGTPAVGASSVLGTYGVAGQTDLNYDITNSAGSGLFSPVITVYPAPTLTGTINATEGVAMTGGFVEPNGAPAADSSWPWWNLTSTSASIPWFTYDDLNGNGTGVFYGTPPLGSAGTYQIVAVYNDSNYTPTPVLYTLNVAPAPPVLNATTTINGTAGVAVSHTLANTGGSGTFAVSNGSLPSGISLNASTGAFTGSTAGGTYTFDVTATNAGGSSTTTVTMTIQSTPVVSSPINLNWRVGASNSYTITPSGGATPMTFAVSPSTPMPSWSTSLGMSTGTLTGTPTTAGSASFDVVVTNSAGSTTVTINITALVAPSMPATTSISTPSVGVPYTYTFPTPSGTGPFTFAIGSGSLPAGLTLNTSTGVISGTPTTAGAASFTVTATNALGAGAAASTSVSTTVTVLAPQYTATVSRYVADSTLVTITQTHTGGSPATSWAAANGSTIPSWLTLNTSTGALSGTSPSSAAVESFSIVGTNSTGSATVAHTITIQLAPGFGSISVPAATIGVPYTYALPTTGTGPFTFNLSGSLPAGLSLNTSTGVISGTPTGTGATGNFTVSINNGLTTQNGTGSATTSSLSLVSSVAAPTATATATLTSANQASVNYTFPQTGGTPASSWSSNNLPTGLSFANGVLTGTPTTPGVHTFTLTGANSAGSASTTVTLTATAPPIVASPLTAPSFTAGLPGSYTIPTSGHPAATSFTTTSTLPNWLTLNPTTGVLSGTPPNSPAANLSFPVTVSNGVGTPTTVTVNLGSVIAAPTLAATTTVPVIGPLVTSTYTVAPTGGTPGTYSLANSPAAPQWVSINPTTGVLTFTNPPIGAIGSHTFGVVSTNSAGSSTTSVSVTVADVPVLPATLSYTIPTGTAWSHDIATDVTSGATPWTFAVASSSTLPGWLTLTGSTVSGTPTSATTDNFTIEVSNANGTSVTAVTIIAVTAPGLTAGALPAATTGLPFTHTVTPTGTGPFTFAVTSGSLPAGLTLNTSTGVISGTPTGPGTSNFAITATNALGQSGAATANMSITTTTVAPTTAATASLNATTTAAYSHTFTSSAGSPVASWTLTSGALPAGLTLNASTGVLSGTATTAGTYTFDIDATNGGGTATTTVTFVVTSPPVVVATATAPTAPTGSAYTYTVPVTAGGGPYTYAVGSGSLPSWATLNTSTGVISGTPTTAGGPNTFTINVTNAVGTSAHVVTLSSAVPVSVTANTTITAVVNQPSTTTITPGGTGPFTYAVTNGQLPSWATLNTSTGAITGTPTTAGSGTFTVTVSGAYGTASTTVAYSATVTAPVFAVTTTMYATETQPLSAGFTLVSGSNPASYSVGSGLPSSLSINTNTGVVSGTPLVGEAGNYTATMTATNSAGNGTSGIALTVLTMPTLPGTVTLSPGTTGTSFTQTLQSGGSGSMSFAVTSGRLPAGLSINPSTGAITGTPRATATGRHTFTVTMTNLAGTTVSSVITMNIAAGVSVPSVITTPKAKTSKKFSYTVKPTGTGPFTYRVSAGSLPPGMKLNSTTGKITGTGTKTGTYTATITISAPGGTTLTTRVVIQVVAGSSTTANAAATASASASPSASPTPSSSASATATPTIKPSASPSASASASSEPGTGTKVGSGINTTWLVGAFAGLAALLGFWWLLVARRRKDEEEES